jgi:hypothetical protein
MTTTVFEDPAMARPHRSPVPGLPAPHGPALKRVAGRLLFAALVSLAGTACSNAGDSAASGIKAPIRGVAEATGFATTTPEAKDFVKSSRNPAADYMPVGITPPARPLKAKNAEEVRAMESDLERTLQQHNAASGRTPTGGKFRSAAGEGGKAAQAPRGSDRFLIPPKPAPTPTPKPKPRNQTNS